MCLCVSFAVFVLYVYRISVSVVLFAVFVFYIYGDVCVVVCCVLLSYKYKMCSVVVDCFCS